MAAPAGNRFWEARTTHGRDKIFAEPEILWAAACEYFIDVEDNPLEEQQWVGKDGDEVKKNKMRPFQYTGLCLFLGVNSKYFCQFEASVKDKEDDISKDFSYVLSRIRDTIYTQKFEGAASGFLNPALVMRDLGITEKTQLEHSGGETPIQHTIVPVTVIPYGSPMPPLPTNENDVDLTRKIPPTFPEDRTETTA